MPAQLSNCENILIHTVGSPSTRELCRRRTPFASLLCRLSDVVKSVFQSRYHLGSLTLSSCLSLGAHILIIKSKVQKAVYNFQIHLLASPAANLRLEPAILTVSVTISVTLESEEFVVLHDN